MRTILKLVMITWVSTLSGCASSGATYHSPQFKNGRFENVRESRTPSFGRIVRHVLFGRNGEWPSGQSVDVKSFQSLAAKDRVRATFVGHATVLLEVGGINILTDPVWSKRVGPFSWFGPKRAKPPGVAFEELPKIDFVVISHNHFDHLDIRTLKRLEKRDQPMFLVPLGDREWLMDEGLTHVQELDWWQSAQIEHTSPRVDIRFVPARHNSGRGLFDRDRAFWGGFWIESLGHRIFFAGDTGYDGHFKDIREKLGSPTLAILPIGAYKPRDFTKDFHLSPEEAVMAFEDLKAGMGLPIHYDLFQLTGEDFGEAVTDLYDALDARGIDRYRFSRVPEGESIDIRPDF